MTIYLTIQLCISILLFFFLIFKFDKEFIESVSFIDFFKTVLNKFTIIGKIIIIILSMGLIPLYIATCLIDKVFAVLCVAFKIIIDYIKLIIYKG